MIFTQFICASGVLPADGRDARNDCPVDVVDSCSFWVRKHRYKVKDKNLQTHGYKETRIQRHMETKTHGYIADYPRSFKTGFTAFRLGNEKS